ncbi:MAG: flavodoxin [Desulfitibacter sp. BRH_c19]|nr:MAG: flavodoxin [Desulfitibacter sp. BRH_c19]
MNISIVYFSSRGTTEKAARILKEYLDGEVKLVNLRKSNELDITDFDAVIIGGSIHAGSMQGKVQKFIKNNQNLLISKKLGLFLCCMREGEEAKEQFENAFPKELKDIAIVQGLFGGEFIFSKMNFIERQIVKKVSGVTEDTSTFNENAIKDFANNFTELVKHNSKS